MKKKEVKNKPLEKNALFLKGVIEEQDSRLLNTRALTMSCALMFIGIVTSYTYHVMMSGSNVLALIISCLLIPITFFIYYKGRNQINSLEFENKISEILSKKVLIELIKSAKSFEYKKINKDLDNILKKVIKDKKDTELMFLYSDLKRSLYLLTEGVLLKSKTTAEKLNIELHIKKAKLKDVEILQASLIKEINDTTYKMKEMKVKEFYREDNQFVDVETMFELTTK